MESLSDTEWDVVISGTGLQHSLLALALSRSAKNILHVDEGEHYGGAEAALSLPELDAWAEKHSGDDRSSSSSSSSNEDEDEDKDENSRIFSAARVVRPPQEESRSGRGYSIALAPQLIHARAALLSQLVSSKAFRQIDFLAVGSFFVYHAARTTQEESNQGAEAEGTEGRERCLHRIPSTREDVFSNAAIPVRAKRALMKFLKFVLEHDSSDTHAALWRPRADEPLAAFLASEFRLDEELQAYVVALTLTLDGRVSVGRGLAAIRRHLASTGVFGPGFAAVYPKWGGLSEIAQVGCRAAAVGGAVYMLGVGVKEVHPSQEEEQQRQRQRLRVTLANDITVTARRLVQARQPPRDAPRLSRLTAVVRARLPSLFETVVDGAPTPSVAVVAFPAGCALEGSTSAHPVYAMVHSADTGECPAGQCVIYLSTLSSPTSQAILAKALSALLSALPDTEDRTPDILYQLSYEQKGAPETSSAGVKAEEGIFAFDLMPLDLAFDDAVLERVREAWEWITDGSEEDRGEYMNFKDREGVDEDEFDN